MTTNLRENIHLPTLGVATCAERSRSIHPMPKGDDALCEVFVKVSPTLFERIKI